jgi:hypothetical protein
MPGTGAFIPAGKIGARAARPRHHQLSHFREIQQKTLTSDPSQVLTYAQAVIDDTNFRRFSIELIWVCAN